MYNKLVTKKEYYNKTVYMCTFIKMEYLVASALVELYDKKKINKISFDEIKQYGIKVEEILLSENINAILLYSNNYAKEFLDDYSQFFEAKDGCIYIKEKVTIEQIREHILSYISIDMLSVLLNVQSLSAIASLN